ncbi:MAG TPA: excalibur calcium-binding domain-containing protein, partial [Sporichthya sp.]|nr:excalibur calcium-binding domain-containing protein [Sporichthya sp.]
MGRRRTTVVVAVLASVLAVPAHGTAAEAAVPRTTPFALLKQLIVTPETTTTAPRSFAAWSKPTVKQCTTLRAQVLAADATGPTPRTCSPAGLRWTDPLTGTIQHDATRMTVVRLVPIEEAWDSGASRWDAKTRKAFANDLGYDGTLVAVSKAGAAKRKDREPSAWNPPEKLTCAYATQWMTVKLRWRLTVDKAEYDALRHVMGINKCDQRSVPGVRFSQAPPPVLPPRPPTRYETCAAAAAAGRGPFLRGRDPEYAWYRDDDGDGVACETVEAVGMDPSSDWRTERVTLTTQPAISGDVTPGASGADYLHVRILRDGNELWSAVSKGPEDPNPTRPRISVPAGVVTTEGTYTAQIWAGGPDATAAPTNAIAMTFRLDQTPPPIPESDGSSAWSNAPDVAALVFSTNAGYGSTQRIPVRPGEHRSWTPPGVSVGATLITVRAQDHAGNLGPATSYGIYT